MNTGYGRYRATYNMVGLSFFNDELPCVWVELPHVRTCVPGVCNCFHLQIPGHPIARLHQFSNDWWSTAKTSWPIPEDRFRRWFLSSRTTWSSIPNS
jgi:hypothetical protein